MRADLGDDPAVDGHLSACAVACLPIGEGRGMVCAEVEKVAGIEGGFVLVEVPWLMRAWRACQSSPLGIGDFRTLLAAREMLARRRTLQEGREAVYGLAELVKLLGITTKRAGASVRRLEAAGLIEWSNSAIGFVDPRVEVVDLDDTIGRGRGSVALPRRMLRFLAGGARPALIATALGILLRCLSRRKDGWSGRGRAKAGWIARTFGTSIRQVKAARAELVSLGWIEAEDSDQWTMNRWGRAYRIDLGWAPAKPKCERFTPPSSSPPVWRGEPSPGPSLTPLPADPGPSLTPPDLQTPIPSGRDKNQEPASGGPAGVEIEGQGTQSPLTTPTPISSPRIDDVQVADLEDTGRLLDLHRQAVAKGMVTTSEADRLRFVGAAEHALAIGNANPPGLFAYLVRGRCWRYITQGDEDRAASRLRGHLRSPGIADRGPHFDANPIGTPPFDVTGTRRTTCLFDGKSTVGRPALSDDARLVKAVRDATIRAGVYRDPWPAFSSRAPGWDRGRWDAAMAELRLA